MNEVVGRIQSVTTNRGRKCHPAWVSRPAPVQLRGREGRSNEIGAVQVFSSSEVCSQDNPRGGNMTDSSPLPEEGKIPY